MKFLFLFFFLLLVGCPAPPFENPPHSPIADMNDVDLHRVVQREEIMRSARVRRNPSFPRIGSFLNQSQTLCNKQNGVLSYNENLSSAVCTISTIPIFKISLEEDIVIGLMVYYEAGDLNEMKQNYIERLGDPRYTIEGERTVLHWIDGNFAVELSTYSLGVIGKLTFLGNRGPIFAMPDINQEYFDYDKEL